MASSGGNFAEVTAWNGTGWTPASRYANGTTSGAFALQFGTGYQVYSDQPGSYVETGRVPSAPAALSLSTGWTLMGLPASSGELASGILASLTTAGASRTAIQRWYGQAYEPLAQTSPGVYAGDDFPIV
jgi:hypothetical protein